MNRFAYLITGLAIKTLSSLSKINIRTHGKKKIPSGSVIFVINHFTRIETFILPYNLSKITNIPVWSLADPNLFNGPLAGLLERVGAVSTKNPNRDHLIVRTLLTGEASWVIFPEGLMVKNKKIVERGRFMLSYAGGKRPPHTGAAALALRTEFYRQRIGAMSQKFPDEAKRLLELFGIDSVESVTGKDTYIVPVNVTYYPLRAKENILSNAAANFLDNIPDRVIEEIMAEGTMLLSGVDIDVRFGDPIKISDYMKHSTIKRDIFHERRINFNDPLPSRRLIRRRALKIMKRYMSAIYSMTTVNHDHLFASVLKHTLFKKIDPYDLKARVYLAATGNIKNIGVDIHHSLEEDQLHLLSDDKYNRFQEFVDLALEKNIIQQKGKFLVKNRSVFSSAFDFHSVRVENPISVMANELEPLALLKRRVRNIAWLPRFLIRHQIVSGLIKKDLLDFEIDYDSFFIHGESKNRETGRPFLIKGKSKKIGVVLIHGYLAAPEEVKELATYLGKRGIWVYVPRLKGHGTSPEDLATRTFADWTESVDLGYAIMRNICKKVVVGGFSMGAGLALEFAARAQDIEGVFAISPPLKLQDFSSRLVPAIGAWNRLMGMTQLDGAKKEFVENIPENPHINYSRNPIAGIRELERLMKAVEPGLQSIKKPALIIQAQGDPVVNPKGSKRVFELLGSKEKKYKIFKQNRHCIISGEGSQKLHQTVADFVEQL